MLSAYHRKGVLGGIKDGLGFVPLYLGLAVPYAMLAQNAGFSTFETLLWSALTYAATLQLAGINAFAAGAEVWAILLIALSTTTKQCFVSLSVAPLLKSFNQRCIPFFSFLVSAPSTGLMFAEAKRGSTDRSFFAYAVSTQILQWFLWVFFTWTGLVLGGMLPQSLEPIIRFTSPAAFTGLILFMIFDELREGLVVVTATVVFLLLLVNFLEPFLASILAALIAAFVGLLYSLKGETSYGEHQS